MQTMPVKTRTAMTVGAILLGLVIVGALALYSNRGKAPISQKSGDPYLTEEMAGSPTHEPVTVTPPITAAPAENGVTATAPTGTRSDSTAPTMTGDQVPQTYVVDAGESLRDIAKKFYGDPVYAADIESLNEIKDPDHIMAGQELKLPRPEALTH